MDSVDWGAALMVMSFAIVIVAALVAYSQYREDIARRKREATERQHREAQTRWYENQ